MNKNYFSFESERAMEIYGKANAEGWENAAGSQDWGHANGQLMVNAEGAGAEDFARPHIISIENTTTTDVTSATILNAAVAFSNYAVSGLSITYKPSTITYGQFLASLLTDEYLIGKMLLIGTNSSNSTLANDQSQVTMTLTTLNTDGRSYSEPMIPVQDSYQQKLNQTTYRVEFYLNKLTKIVIDTIYASTKLELYLYPRKKTGGFAQVNSGSALSFAAPSVNPALGR